MRKVKFTEAEAAALIVMVADKISEAEELRAEMKEVLLSRTVGDKIRLGALTGYDYWTERLHMLRQLMPKLEREEMEGDDG